MTFDHICDGIATFLRQQGGVKKQTIGGENERHGVGGGEEEAYTVILIYTPTSNQNPDMNKRS